LLSANSTIVNYEFSCENKHQCDLTVYLVSGKRLEGVRYDVKLIEGKPEIIEDSIEIVCMIKGK